MNQKAFRKTLPETYFFYLKCRKNYERSQLRNNINEIVEKEFCGEADILKMQLCKELELQKNN